MTDKPLSGAALERLRDAVSAFGSQTKIAAASGIPKATISQILAKGGDVTLSRLLMITEPIGVSIDYILHGASAGSSNVVARSIGAPVEEAFGKLPLASALGAPFDGSVSDRGQGYTAQPSALTSHIVIQAPNEVRASAGDGSIVAGEGMIDSPVAFREDWLRARFGKVKGLRLIQIGGDSQEPDLRDGDWVMIDEDKRDIRNGLAVIVLDDCLMVKRLQLEGRFLQLMSRNPAYAPIAIDLTKEEERIRIVGKAVYTLKSQS